jgi:predicted dehydrogenase
MTTVIKERIKLDGSGYAPVTVDDITSFIAKLKGDIITNFLVTKCAIGERNTIKYEIYGTDGAIKFNLNEPDVIEMCLSPEIKEAGVLETVKVPDQFSLDEEMCFIDSVNGIMHDYYPTVKDGAKAQIVVDAVLESATQGKTVVL